jgi:hypothetical protein
VADDFVPPEPPEDGGPTTPEYEGMMLNYVTVTRAINRIQLGALAEPGLWDL